MIEINEIFELEEKSIICRDILRALPNWFGIEASIIDYIEQVRNMTFYAALDNTDIVGFVALKVHNAHTSEIYVMGIMQEFHRHGIGRMLVERCEDYCKKHKMDFLTVKTLDESRESESYKKTRLFYQALGFKALEVFPLLWGEDNPCLFLAKNIQTKGSV